MSNQFDADQQQATQQPAVQPQKSNSKGCLFGCLIAAGLVIGSLMCMGIGGYWFYKNQLNKYTSDTPMELPVVDYTPEQIAQVEQRLEAFNKSAESGDPTVTELVLTADEINALITKNEDFKGKVYVKIEDGEISGDVSVPTDMLPGGKGRYFNGSATVDASMNNGELFVTLKAAEVNGESLPAEFLEGFRGKNLAEEAYKDPKNREALSRFEDIRIEGDKLILKLKPVEADDAGGEGVSSEDEAEPANTESADAEPAGA